MPSKGRQRASRQAQLKNRKRKTSKNSNVFDSRGKVEENRTPSVQNDSGLETTPTLRQTPQRPTTRSTGSGTLEYTHLSGELRQIGIVALLIIIIITALTFSPII